MVSFVCVNKLENSSTNFVLSWWYEFGQGIYLF